jgi:hypothetical protein
MWPPDGHSEHEAHVNFRGALLEPTAVTMRENATVHFYLRRLFQQDITISAASF